ncbi:MAG: methionyl-tRNA formyltransferase [Phycisphaerae bacterium]|nr:methionyl-tRNA formyltransferase [Phycisphaerae bacterium]
MRLGFFGSGAFGLPTLEAIMADHEVVFVVSQPDRPAGRRRQLRATPISELAMESGIDLLRPEKLDAAQIETIRSFEVDAWVVIAYGLKLPPALLEDRFSCNLHGSLLPRWRGAAPIQRCLMAGDEQSGVSVITLASVMDAGDILAEVATHIDPLETAGELHDRLAKLGPSAVLETLAAHQAGTLSPRPQDESEVTFAAKLSRSEATVDLSLPAERVRGQVHGLTPWPGCDVRIGDGTLRLRRVRAHDVEHQAHPGAILDSGHFACGVGSIEILEVQPAGGRPMKWTDWVRGHPLSGDERMDSL